MNRILLLRFEWWLTEEALASCVCDEQHESFNPRFYAARTASLRLPSDPFPRNTSSSRASADALALVPARKASAIFPARIAAFNFSSPCSAKSATAPKIADTIVRFSAGASGRSCFDVSLVNIDFTQSRGNPTQRCRPLGQNERCAGMPRGSDCGTFQLAADYFAASNNFDFSGIWSSTSFAITLARSTKPDSFWSSLKSIPIIPMVFPLTWRGRVTS